MATRDIYIQITLDCIHDCIFCSTPKKKIYLSVDEIKRRIDRYKELNYTDINITGGEPTLHPDLLEIIRYGVKKGFEVRMTTNGVKLADYSFMKAIKEAGLHRILFSIHHYDPHQEMIINGVDEPDLDKTLQGVKNADKLNIDININITIIKQNYKALPGIIRMLIPRFKNIHHFNFNFVDIIGNVLRENAQYKPTDIAPRYSEVEKYLVKAFQLLKKYKISFRFERAPLCYAPGFEAYNSNANRAVGTEFHATTFTEDTKRDIDDSEIPMVKSQFCRVCSLNDICFGVEPSYNKLYGTSELYPVFINPNKVEYEIKNQNPHKEILIYTKRNIFSKEQLKSLFNKVGGLSTLLRRGENYIINAIPLVTKNDPLKVVINHFFEIIKANNYDLSYFRLVDPIENKSLREIALKNKIKVLKPREYGFVAPYDPYVISSLKLPKEIIESYGVINILEVDSNTDTVFNFLLKVVSPYLREKVKKFEGKKYYHALLDIYSRLKQKIKLNLVLFTSPKYVISLSRDLATQDYFLESMDKKYKTILDLVSTRELGPENDSKVLFEEL